jgi:hypothetical protein
MAQKRIEIIYDVNGKAIDVAVDKTLNLKKQVVELTKALRSTKEGSDEFRLLSTRLGDAQDGLAKTTAKSKDLFSSLSMLPGPVGQFFNQLQGGIELLKTFSSFSLKDLKFQFGETVNDIKDIKEGFGGVSDGIKNTTDTTKESVNVFREQGDTIASVIDESKALVDQMNLQKAAVKNVSDLTAEGKLMNDKYVTGLVMNAETGQLVTGVINKQTNATRVLTQSELQLVASGKAVTLTTEGMIVAENAATVATFTLAGAIKALGIALGIGGLLILLTFVIDKLIEGTKYLIDFFKGTLAAEEATRKLSKSLDELDISFEKSNKSLKRATNERIALMKAQGATEEQIRKATIDGLIKERDITSKTLGETVEIIKKLQKNRGDNDEENNKEIERALKKKRELEETYKDQSSAIRVSEYNNITENNKKILENQKKANDDAQKLLEKRNADKKTADEAYRQLLQENSVLYLKTERERQLKELKNQAENEALKIDALDISTTRKEEIKLQIFKKYAAKTLELGNKFNDEDLKKQQDHFEKVQEMSKKLNDIAIAAIEDQSKKEKAERESKYDEEIKDIKKAFSDKLISEDEYNTAVKNLKIALENDLKKIDEDKKNRENEAMLKKLDDDIRFQEISNEANKNSFIAYWKGRETLLEKSKQRELAQLDLTEDQKLAIEKKYVQLSKDLQREKFEAYVGYLNQGLGAVQNVLNQELAVRNLRQQAELDDLQLAFNAQQEYNSKTMSSKEEFDKQTVENERELAVKQDKIKEQYFNKNKDAQYALALINASQAAISAYAALAPIPVVGPALGIAAAAVALAYGIKQANLIKAQKYVSGVAAQGPDESTAGSGNMGKNYGEGGMIEGPRHAGGGVMINAEGGEAVMTRGAVTMFAPLLSAMNQMGGGTSFTRGAAGQAGFDNPRTTETITQPQIVKTYVVSNELTSEAQKQARLKDLSIL